MNFELEYDMSVESDEELRGLLGLRELINGQIVTVEATGRQIGEICTVTVTGELSAIIAWMEERMIDRDSLLQEIQEAITNEALHPIG